MTPETVLDIRDLRVSFDTAAGEARAVRGASFSVGAGEAVALAGESGCGKSVTARSILRLNPPQARYAGGSITLCGRDVLGASEAELREMRGALASMIFQDPMTCLNPTMRVGAQIAEAVSAHGPSDGAEEEAIRMMEMARIPDAPRRARQYPHELSGGMRQRVMIAMALSCRPRLLIADEPTTALDVTTQAAILRLIADLREETGAATLLITHDLAAAALAAGRIIVMYAGTIAESASTEEIFRAPAHPYTRALLSSLPSRASDRSRPLASIPGSPPGPLAPPPGCGFAPRCRDAMRICREEAPPVFRVSRGGDTRECAPHECVPRERATHEAACWLLHPSCPPERRDLG